MSYHVSLVQIKNLSFLIRYMNILAYKVLPQGSVSGWDQDYDDDHDGISNFEITMFPEKIFEKFSRIEIVASECDVDLSMP